MKMTKLSDPLGRAFIEFCRSQGIKFVDGETGEEVFTDEEPMELNNNKRRQL